MPINALFLYNKWKGFLRGNTLQVSTITYKERVCGRVWKIGSVGTDVRFSFSQQLVEEGWSRNRRITRWFVHLSLLIPANYSSFLNFLFRPPFCQTYQQRFPSEQLIKVVRRPWCCHKLKEKVICWRKVLLKLLTWSSGHPKSPHFLFWKPKSALGVIWWTSSCLDQIQIAM